MIETMKKGYCQDIWCENPETQDALTQVKYIDSNKTTAWICQDCLEQWSDTLEDYTQNMTDFNLPDAYPFIP